jgi:hypothetical protein
MYRESIWHFENKEPLCKAVVLRRGLHHLQPSSVSDDVSEMGTASQFLEPALLNSATFASFSTSVTTASFIEINAHVRQL